MMPCYSTKYCLISSLSQETFILLVRRQFIYYFVRTVFPSTPFRHNHCVPLIFHSAKNKENKKRKLVTSQINKESKKRATYSIHHFWKQDLSANNSLPNFADDLNGNKSPRVSNSSTFNDC